MEKLVIACYQPLPGKESELDELMKTHWDILNNEGLVSQRNSILMKSKDGIVIEVFGWKSKAAIEAAHSNPVVMEMWKEYAAVCRYVPLNQVSESQNLFSEFTPFS